MNIPQTQTADVSVKSFHPNTVYTAGDFPGYTIQHALAMYPTSWKEAAKHFGVVLPNNTVDFNAVKKIEQIKHNAIEQGIWDFYPTPATVIQKMIDAAKVQPYHRVLEPSAGTGDLSNAIAKITNRIDCYEINRNLQTTLTLQGFNLLGSNFLASPPQPIYDRILANPPFSNHGVNLHTRHAFKFLKPGGRLVTLSHHYKLKPSQSDKQFFTWLKDHKAKFLNLGQAFKHSDRQTNALIQLIAIDKP